MTARRVAVGRISPGVEPELRTSLTWLCSSIACELRDLERATLRWSPSQGRHVVRDGCADALLEHVAHIRELLRRIEDEHCTGDKT